jgi:acetoin utilization deacetylase AcuC-like enzyme
MPQVSGVGKQLIALLGGWKAIRLESSKVVEPQILKAFKLPRFRASRPPSDITDTRLHGRSRFGAAKARNPTADNDMIIYDKNLKEGLSEFGIEIPIHHSRAARTFEKLKDHEILGPKIDQWLVSSINETITREDLLRVHSDEYVARLYSNKLEDEIIRTFELIDDKSRYYRYNPRKATLPLTQLFERLLFKVAGTVQCCRLALAKDFCFAFGGGMHHAKRDYGAGFCIVNDIVIALRKLQAENLIHTALVIDLDAHKGDGTAVLTREDSSITTLSIHMARGWPLDGEAYDHQGRLNPSFVPSDIDIPVAAGEEHLYVAKLQDGLEKLIGIRPPDLAIVLAGSDPYEKDELPSTGELKLSLEQLKERDILVYHFLKVRGIPRAYVTAGGYGAHAWEVDYQFVEWALLDNL